MKRDVVESGLVGHRSYAMKPRQSRQVRKEATVTGRFVRSEFPVSGFTAFGATGNAALPAAGAGPLPGAGSHPKVLSIANYPVLKSALFRELFLCIPWAAGCALGRSWGKLVCRR